MARREEDDRALAQHVHQKPWTEHNPNHEGSAAGGAGSSAAWEAEVRRLTSMGIQSEELKIYSRTVNSWDQRVNRLNDEIVVKINAIAGCRRMWYDATVTSANKKELSYLVKQMEALDEKITDLKKMVRNLRGQPEQTPVLFNQMPAV